MSTESGQTTGRLHRAWIAYRLRWKRRELLWRAIRTGRRLSPLSDRTASIGKGDILLFASIRNEAARLPEFLAHYRRLGVQHFLIVDNDSNDGSTEFLLRQSDLSLWRSRDSYRTTRFGMDWVGALLLRHGHDHWCVTVDADELLVYPDWDRRNLSDLTSRLDGRGQRGMGALMLDLYPRAPLGQADALADAPLTERLPWFDAGPYRCTIAQPKGNRIVRGGVRERVFFSSEPDRAPTLNKLPLIRWHWRYVYVNSTHSLLPAGLNDLYDGPGDSRLSGVLLHSKFLPEIVEKSVEELQRRQHFTDPDSFVDYHRAIADAPILWHGGSLRYQGWKQMVELGLMGTGESPPAPAIPGDVEAGLPLAAVEGMAENE
ncbi:glycosyltransferase family 2 protein [Paracoccus methylarcula]|uniref:Glycosyltransferase family 2 protein n=1 Tax=Paracoccus methylarcula TaxID=72022 RepID=A0A422QXW7_9RHOB|nr:glycosyltransferase family 2 protein [Paracoccus methylarcula]RNF34763.1 glycosyltransferase family 2 protein [Paracoccus methylarcula]